MRVVEEVAISETLLTNGSSELVEVIVLSCAVVQGCFCWSIFN